MAKGVDPTSGVPAYRQMADRLRERIASGELAPGDRVPSEAELMETYSAARATVRQAIGVLRTEGLVVAEQGRGAFVRSRPPVRRLASDRFARRHRRRGQGGVRGGDGGPATGGRGAGSRGLCRTGRGRPAARGSGGRQGAAPVPPLPRRRAADGDRTSYIPWALAEGTAMVESNPGPGGIYARIEEQGRRLGRGSLRTSRPGCRQPRRLARWRCQRALRCFIWSGPPMTPTARPSRCATR